MTSLTLPEGLKYHKEHTWAAVSYGIATVGITDYAQDHLGPIFFIDLPEIGTAVKQGTPFGCIESMKAVSDLLAPLSGEVVEVNVGLLVSPEMVNNSPYDEGWIIKIRVADPEELAGLYDHVQYAAMVGS